MNGGNELEIDTFTLGHDGPKFVGRRIMPFDFEFENPGVHWLNVYIDGQLRGRTPLWVRYERELVH